MPDFNNEEGFRDDTPRPKANGHAPDDLGFYDLSERHSRGKIRREWLIEDLVPRRGVGILSGQSSVGKTHIVLDLMASVVLGEPFAGFAVERIGCGVVLFAAEGQDDVIPRWDVIEVSKITPYRQMYGLPPDSYYPATCVDQVPRLTLADAYEQYRTRLVTVAMRQRSHVGADYSGLGLAIIDTYTAATDLSDDQTNAAGTNQQIFTRLHRLSRELDCFVLVVDHMGKDTARGTRGSTAKEASADVVLTVTGTVSDEGIVSNTAMVVRKLRGGAINKRVMFSLQPVVMPRDEEGHRRDGVVVKWDVASAKLRQGRGPAAQNRRHPLLMMAIDNALLDALPAQWEMVKNGAHAFRAVDEGLIREKFRVCHPATDEDGPQRLDTIRKAYARAMKACLVSRAIGQITLADGKLRIWRTDYSHQDTSNVSRD